MDNDQSIITTIGGGGSDVLHHNNHHHHQHHRNQQSYNMMSNSSNGNNSWFDFQTDQTEPLFSMEIQHSPTKYYSTPSTIFPQSPGSTLRFSISPTSPISLSPNNTSSKHINNNSNLITPVSSKVTTNNNNTPTTPITTIDLDEIIKTNERISKRTRSHMPLDNIDIDLLDQYFDEKQLVPLDAMDTMDNSLLSSSLPNVNSNYYQNFLANLQSGTTNTILQEEEDDEDDEDYIPPEEDDEDETFDLGDNDPIISESISSMFIIILI